MQLPGKKIVAEIKHLPGLRGAILRFLQLDKLFNFIQALASTAAQIKIFGIKKFNAKWLRESYEFDVRKYLTLIKCPALVLGGEKTYRQTH